MWVAIALNLVAIALLIGLLVLHVIDRRTPEDEE